MIKTHNTDAAAPLKLSNAILLYSAGRAGSIGEQSYATIHNVKSDNNQSPVIEEGVALCSKELKRILKSLEPKKKKMRGFLPENVLINDDGLMVWWTPAQKRMTFFKTDADTMFGKMNGTIHYPAMVYILADGSLSVYALKEDKRPSLDTPLFNAPLMNVFADGGVCTGNVTFPKTATLDNLANWENALLDSYFTHTNHQKVIQGCKGGVKTLYLDMMNGKYKKFPTRYLAPTNATLGQIIDTKQG